MFGQKFGRKKSFAGPRVSSVTYSVSSRFVLRQVKYVYDCENPSFASWFITFGRVNASARKTRSGRARRASAMSHSQNRNGFVWGLSTRKMRTPSPAQNSTTPRSAAHSSRHRGPSNSSG